MRPPLSTGLLKELAGSTREGAVDAATGTRVKLERAVSTTEQLQSVIAAIDGPVESRNDVFNGSWSFLLPTLPFETTVQTVGLWHCNEGADTTAADSSDNGNDLALANTTWVAGKFGNGLRFDGASSVATATLTSEEPVRKFLYFAVWANPTSGPFFNWDGVMEVYISGGSLVADIEGTTYTGPPVGSGWQLFHCQFYAGKVFIGVDDIVWAFDHGDDMLTVSAWAIEIGKRGATYYDGDLDEIRLVADVVVQEDWGKRYMEARQDSVLYCLLNRGYGDLEHHADFIGPVVTLNGVTWITGYIGQAISFDGSDDFASFPPNAALTPANVSIHLVVRFDVLDACTLIDQTSGLNLEWDGTHLVAALNGVTNPASQIGPLDIAIDTWYDIAVTYDGSVKAAWLNGQKTGEVAATGTANIPATTVYVGRTVAGAEFFEGDMDLIQIATGVVKPQNRPIPRFIIGKYGFEVGEDWVLLDD